MIGLVETDASGEGNRYVAGVHWIMMTLYGIAIVYLFSLLFGALRVAGFDASAAGMSWTLTALLGMAAFHVVTAFGARLGRSWARTLSRAFALLLVPLFPIGTAVAFVIFRNTSHGRWTSGGVDGAPG